MQQPVENTKQSEPLRKVIILNYYNLFLFFSVHVFHTNNDSDDSDGEINHGDKAYRLRLTKALACLGVKPSNFNALVVVDKYDEVEQLLKEHLIRTTHEFQHRYRSLTSISNANQGAIGSIPLAFLSTAK